MPVLLELNGMVGLWVLLSELCLLVVFSQCQAQKCSSMAIVMCMVLWRISSRLRRKHSTRSMAGIEIAIVNDDQLDWYLSQFRRACSLSLSCFGFVVSLGRAKQFSSFILLLGKIPAPDRFDPVCAITLQNKEEIDIPLVLEAIPSAKVV